MFYYTKIHYRDQVLLIVIILRNDQQKRCGMNFAGFSRGRGVGVRAGVGGCGGGGGVGR